MVSVIVYLVFVILVMDFYFYTNDPVDDVQHKLQVNFFFFWGGGGCNIVKDIFKHIVLV